MFCNTMEVKLNQIQLSIISISLFSCIPVVKCDVQYNVNAILSHQPKFSHFKSYRSEMKNPIPDKHGSNQGKSYIQYYITIVSIMFGKM